MSHMKLRNRPLGLEWQVKLHFMQGCKSSFSNELPSVHQFIMVHELQFSSSSYHGVQELSSSSVQFMYKFDLYQPKILHPLNKTTQLKPHLEKNSQGDIEDGEFCLFQ